MKVSTDTLRSHLQNASTRRITDVSRLTVSITELGKNLIHTYNYKIIQSHERGKLTWKYRFTFYNIVVKCVVVNQFST